MKPPNKTPSEALLHDVRKEIKRRQIPLGKAAREMGVRYITLFFVLKSEKRSYKRVGRPRFAFDTGIQMLDWVASSKSKSVN